jgi:hypothetical protein
MRNIIALSLSTLVFIACDPTVVTSDIRDPLMGNWTCKEAGGQSYQVAVSKAPYEEDKMYFNNLYNLSKNVEVTILGSTLSIPVQIVDNFELKGSGSVSSDKKKITLNFTADTSSVQATMTKN